MHTAAQSRFPRIVSDSYPVPRGLPSVRVRWEVGHITLDILTIHRRYLLSLRLL
jgi:hypothetical protein